MNRRLALVVLVALVPLAGCDAYPRIHSAGVPTRVQCWSGGTPVFDGKSLGGARADGSWLTFVDAASGAFISIQADCVVRGGPAD